MDLCNLHHHPSPSNMQTARGIAAGRSPLTEGLRVLVLDRAPLPEVSAPLGEAPELRVSTLTPASVRLFSEAGAWDDMAPPRSAPFQHMQVHTTAGLLMPLYIHMCSRL